MGNRKSKRVKLLLALLLTFCLVMTFGLAGCGSSQENTEPAEEVTEQAEEAVDAAEDAVESTEEAVTEDASATQDTGDKIGEQKALEIALKDAGVAESDAEYAKSKFDIDDGREIYEVEFNQGTTEYDYDIDAYTGEILDKDVDNDND